MKQFHGIVRDENVELPQLPLASIGALNALDTRLMSSTVLDQMVLFIYNFIVNYLCFLIMLSTTNFSLFFFRFQILKLKPMEKPGTVKVKVRVLFDCLLQYELAKQFTWTGKTCKHECKCAFSTIVNIQYLHY